MPANDVLNLRTLLMLLAALSMLGCAAPLDAWRHRQTITVTEPVGLPAHSFPVSFELNAVDLAAAGKMQADGADVRILIAGDETPYQLESVGDGRVKVTFQIDLAAKQVRRDIVLLTGNSSAVAPKYGTGWGSINEGMDGFENELLRVGYGVKKGTFNKLWGCMSEFVVRSIDEDQLSVAGDPYTWGKSRNDVTYWVENTPARITAIEAEGPIYRRFRIHTDRVVSDDQGELLNLTQTVTFYRDCPFIYEEYTGIKGAVVDVCSPGGMVLRNEDGTRNFDYVALGFDSTDITWEGRGEDKDTRGGWTANPTRAAKDPRYRFLPDYATDGWFMMGVINVHNGRGIASCADIETVGTSFFVDWYGNRAGYSFWPRGGRMTRYLYYIENGRDDAVDRARRLAAPPEVTLAE